jgi:apolipoprotein N-acyltransferase
MLRKTKDYFFANNNSNFKYFFIGMLGAFGFAPFNLYPIFIAVFSWFLAKAYDNSLVSLQKSFLFFLGFYIATLYWLAIPLTVDFSKHFVLIPFAVTLIPAYFSAQMLIPIAILRYFRGIFSKSFVFSVLYTVIIYIHGHGSFGFPWIFSAYIWNSHELFMQTLSIYGVYGLSFITILLTSFLGAAIFYRNQDKTKQSQKYLTISASIFLSICIFGVIRLAKNPTEYTPITARIVQPNIQHQEKKQRKDMLNRMLELSRNTGDVNLLIWPEATIPYLYSENLRGLHQLLSGPLVGNFSYLIAGAVREDFAENIYNSAVIIDHFGRNIHNYDKIHLVPFGEYIPFRSFLPFGNITNDIGDFNIGSVNHNSVQLCGLKIVLAICYEAVFPVDCMPSGDKQSIDLMINLTNDGWFGFSTQPFQHLQIVRTRAIEMGIPLIRATNIGISAVFDPLGREIKRIQINTIGYIDFKIPSKLSRQTLFSTFCF